MVIRVFPRPQRHRCRAALIAEAVVALGILVTVMLPIAFSFMQETKLCRSYYYKSIALEVVDGEMEILAAGEWRAFAQGPQPYAVRVSAATNLPPGKFVLILDGQRMRLEWLPQAHNVGGVVAREALTK